jgi:hypothetical protein
MDPARMFTESLTPRPELENDQDPGRTCGELRSQVLRDRRHSGAVWRARSALHVGNPDRETNGEDNGAMVVSAIRATSLAKSNARLGLIRVQYHLSGTSHQVR